MSTGPLEEWYLWLDNPRFGRGWMVWFLRSVPYFEYTTDLYNRPEEALEAFIEWWRDWSS